MKPEFKDYVISLGLEGAVLERIDYIIGFYSKFLGFEVEDIFISEYLNADGSRVYENFWIFNNEVCGESKQFLATDDFDCDKIKNTVYDFDIKTNDFDIVNNISSDKSRMYLLYLFPHFNRAGEMKASKENCKKLRDIFLKYILPNFKK